MSYGGFDKYVESYKFPYNNIDQLVDVDDKPIGLIYDLYYKPKPEPFPSNLLPKIGLKNIGPTCYMNATLRSLAQIEQLVQYFKNKQNTQIIDSSIAKCKQNNKKSLTESFKILIDNLWPEFYNSNLKRNNNNYYYSPLDFKNKISSMNPLFQGVLANEDKDLINFIIITLHEELNVKTKLNFLNNNINIKINQNNQQLVYQQFFDAFHEENESVISTIFFGINHTLVKCSNCFLYQHNFEVFFSLVFPLEKIRKYKLNNNDTKMNANKMFLLQNNIVDIEDGFEYNQKIESYEGESAMYCNNCKKQAPSLFQTKLFTGPEVLIITLNRGEDNQFKIKLNFYLQLNLSHYIEDQTSGYMYDLISAIIQSDDKHLIAICKSPVDNNWYKYDDDLVNPITDFNTQVLNYAMPYILFYKKNIKESSINK